jgi:serine/threonine-protein kinase
MDNQTQTSPASGTPAASMTDLTGQTLGDFQILRKLGQGGMGQVYLAEQISLKRKVALKLLRPELAANETALTRFKREAESVARATHANIVQVYFIGEHQGLHFMALEYVEGRNLRDYLARKGPPELLLGLSIVRQIAAALQRASELGIIHRDIKPENILLTRKAEVKVADFGLSRVLEGEQPAVHLTQSGVTMGTPLYMSPEQVEGKPLDHRTDIYSLGVTCYHMFAGEPPFRGSTAFEVALKHVKEEPTPLASIRTDLPPELCAVVHKMMAKNPNDRYQNGRDLLKDLVRVREALNGATGFVPIVTTGAMEKGATTLTPTPIATPKSTAAPAPGRGLSKAILVSLFVVSLLFAGGIGIALGWKHQHNTSPAEKDERDAVVSEPGTSGSLGLKSREQKYLDAIEEMLDKNNGFKDPNAAIPFCLNYALPLLDQKGRLDEADALFRRLQDIPKDEYSLVGKLGRGIVFSLKDDWQMSMQAFNSVSVKRPMEVKRAQQLNELLRSNPKLVVWLREAIHRNEVNSKGESNTNLPFFLRFLGRQDGPKKDDRPMRDRPGPKDQKP